jgi:uncharacterized protein (TIGR03066 family)
MRAILGCAVVLGLACAATAGGQAKIDAKKLVGKWELVPEKDKKDKAVPTLVEFGANAKVSFTIGVAGQEVKVDGTYKLESDKLSVQLKYGDKDIKETLTVKKLTDDELVTEDSKSKTETLKRKK